MLKIYQIERQTKPSNRSSCRFWCKSCLFKESLKYCWNIFLSLYRLNLHNGWLYWYEVVLCHLAQRSRVILGWLKPANNGNEKRLLWCCLNLNNISEKGFLMPNANTHGKVQRCRGNPCRWHVFMAQDSNTSVSNGLWRNGKGLTLNYWN